VAWRSEWELRFFYFIKFVVPPFAATFMVM
jgi:hypothetical protein